MNTDTPETDAHLLGGSYSFDAEFARNLERQRNKAIDECIALRQMARELRDELKEACAWPIGGSWYEQAEATITKSNQLLP